ncbi:MAG: SRPBCC family protein [Flavobacteriaceae bacterium]
MKIYRLHSLQELPISTGQAWEFLSSPANLSVITPPHMGFKILTGGDRPMFPGQIIQYKVYPFKGIAMRWVTEITHVKQGEYFVDEQRFGPYSLWHHKHFILPKGDGVVMEDIIDYKLPLGFLGRLMHRLFIKNQLERIFEYRTDKLIEIFGSVPGSINKISIQ